MREGWPSRWGGPGLACHREPRRWALLGQDVASLTHADSRTSQNQWKVPHPLYMYR